MIDVLIIDDDSVDRQIIRIALADSQLQTRICEACTAADCFRILAEKPFDCLVLDYQLPDMDGIDVLRQLAQFTGPTSPAVVMLTGSGNEKVAVDAMKLGIRDYLVKGQFTPEDLEESVRKAVEEQHRQNADDLERQRVRQLALADALTGLGNRNLLDDRLDHALKLAQRNRGFVGVMLLDLNGFKQINDTHGHQAGDTVLIEVAQRLKDSTRESDTVARLGGDEFVIVMEADSSPVGAGIIAERIRLALSRPIEFEGSILWIGASIGIACYPNDAGDRVALLRAADAAMYRHKHKVRIG